MKIGFIGAGKVGTSLGNYFSQKGLSVSGYYSKSSSSSQRSAKLTGSSFFKDLDSLLKASEIIFITTGDDAIDGVVNILRESSNLNKNHILVHTSGALSSDIFGPMEKLGCGVCSLHPIMTFSEVTTPVKDLEVTKFTLEGNTNGKDEIQKILKTTNNQFFIINKDSKILYHAAACVLSNYMVTLIDSGFEMLKKSGIDQDEISDAFLPLITATLSNVQKMGTVNALTGPIVRGDENTISKHMDAIESTMPETLNFYQTMGIATLNMIKDKRIDSVKYQKLMNIVMKGKKMKSKFTVSSFLKAKADNEKITMLTAYDYSMAKIVDGSGIDAILVGDSLGMVVQGYESTLEVTMDDMVYHCKAVARGTENALIVGDMPFLSYHISEEEAVRNAGRLIQEGKAHAVKLEGGVDMADKVRAIVKAQIPVMGHIGLTPQSVNVFGGFKVQGKDKAQAVSVIEDAVALEKAGAFAIVLEGIPEKLAKLITEKISIPTIGIGAGRYCDGQVLVIHDLLGMYSGQSPKFSKRYAALNETIQVAIENYIGEVKDLKFPEEKHTFTIDDKIIEEISK